MSQENVSQNSGTSQEQIEQSSNELSACKMQVQELQARLGYLAADFDNYRRNADKDRILWYGKAQAEVLLQVLTIVDDFDRAFEATQVPLADPTMHNLKSWIDGFSMIRQSLSKILEKYDVKEMPASGQFDPERHEALAQVQSADHASGEIVSVIRKGYLFKGAVLRTALVTVAE